MRPEAEAAGLLIELEQMRQRLALLEAELRGVTAEKKYWEDLWREELARRYRAMEWAAQRGLHIPGAI